MLNDKITKISNPLLVAAAIIIAILSRLIPHPPNVNAMNSVVLLLGARLSAKMAIAATLLAMIIADLLIANLFGYPVVGHWTWFTLTGYLAVSQLGKWLSLQRKYQWLNISMIGSLLFWLWTNFGTWLTSGMYPHSMLGLSACYTMALPFLCLAVLGDLLWMSVIIFGFNSSTAFFKEATDV